MTLYKRCIRQFSKHRLFVAVAILLAAAFPPPGGAGPADFVHAKDVPIVSGYSDSLDERGPTIVVATSDSIDGFDVDPNYRCDGTDDQVEIQAAIDALSSGGTIRLLEGKYAIASTISISTDYVRLLGDPGVVLECSGMTSVDTIIQVSGDETSSTLLYTKAPVSNGDTSITVTSSDPASGGYSAGDLIAVYSISEKWKGTLCEKGELQRIKSVSANTINTGGPDVNACILDSYAGATTRVRKIDPVNGLEIAGIKFVGTSGKNLWGIELLRCVNPEVHHCEFHWIESRAIGFTKCLGGSALYNYFYHCSRLGYGYGIGVNTLSTGVNVSHNTGYLCRHVTSLGYTSGTIEGPPRNISFCRNFGMDAGDSDGDEAVFDTHEIGENIDFIGNVAIGGANGIHPTMHSGRVIGNTIIGTSEAGISCYGNENTEMVLIADNLVERAGGVGIYVYLARNVTVTSNVIRGSGRHGIHLASSGNNLVNDNWIQSASEETDNKYSGIFIQNSAQCQVIGNTVRQGTGTNRPKYGINLYSDVFDCVVNNNDVRDGGKRANIRDGNGNNIIRYNRGYPPQGNGTGSTAYGGIGASIRTVVNVTLTEQDNDD